MNRRLALGALVGMPAVMLAGDLESPEHFMARVRNPQSEPFWVRLDGEIRHKKGKKFQAIPLKVRILMRADRLKVQIDFNSGERYLIEQPYGSPAMPAVVTAIAKPSSDATTLSDVGITPEDLALGFLHWQFVRELTSEKVKLQPCRVMDLRRPEAIETVRVWISKEFLFPLAVEWRKDDVAPAHRRLEYKVGTKVKGVMLLRQFDVTDVGWKSSVRFAKLDAGFIRPDKPVPADLFLN